MPEAALEKLRPICLELPEVIETVTYGNPTFMAGKRGWTSLRLADGMDWHEVRALVLMSYRLVTLKRMLKALDSG